ncbi:MAG: hypothetical protein ACLPSO_03000 [Terracidiphilus sp.]
MHTGPGSGAASGPGTILCVMRMMVVMMMIVVVVVVVMMMGCERRTGKHHQEQCDGKYFLHAKNVPLERRRR